MAKGCASAATAQGCGNSIAAQDGSSVVAVGEQYHNMANAEHCCNWDLPIHCSSDVVVYREGEVRHCADNPKWGSHPMLRTIPANQRRQFCEQKITQWLQTSVPRMAKESFQAYLRRCSAMAELELKQTKRMHIGDEYIHALDRFVFRLFMGCRSKQRVKGVSWGVNTEELVLQLLREECVALRENGDLALDPKLSRNPTVFPWPPQEMLQNFEYTKIPPQMDTLTRMDSR